MSKKRDGSSTAARKGRLTAPELQRMKREGRRITMLTAYDATFARLLDDSGIDLLLVGDSLGMVIQGAENTLSVTLDEIIYHTRAVVRGSRRAHVVGDMPFMSYQTSTEEGLRNAGRLIKEGGAQSVKLEGGRRHVELVRRIVEIGVPVMGHIGLTPQSVHAMGGYRVQGRKRAEARRLLEDALALQEAGIYALVLEGVPLEVAQRVTEALEVPTIGIGAGPECDGQVLVVYDLLGLDDAFAPKFVKRYETLAQRVRSAVGQFAEEVRQGEFPSREHSFSVKRSKSRASRPADERGERDVPRQRQDAGDGAEQHGELAETIPLYPGVKG